MHLQTFLASLWACIPALLLAAHAAPVTPNIKLTSMNVEQFHLASEVLKNVKYLTDAYQHPIDKTQNTTDSAFQSIYNRTMAAVTKKRAQELKIAIGLMSGALLHGPTTVNETTAMLQIHKLLEAPIPGPEVIRMISDIAERMNKFWKSHSGLHIAVVETSLVSRGFHGTIIFNGKELAPFCDRSIPFCFASTSCPHSQQLCPGRRDEHISITTSNSIPDIVLFNHTIYQPLPTSENINSTNGVTQHDLKSKNDTTEARPTKKLPLKCLALGSPELSPGLPRCLTGNFIAGHFPSCPKSYSTDIRRELNRNPTVICTLEQPIEAASLDHVFPEPPPKSRTELDGNHTIFLPQKCAPRSQTDIANGTTLCPNLPSRKGTPQAGPCPYMYTLAYERNVMICYLRPTNQASAISDEKAIANPLIPASTPDTSPRNDWVDPLCPSGILVYINNQIVCVSLPPKKKEEDHSFSDCDHAFWGC